LRAGELVAVPTETVYGLAANALDVEACRGIFHAKGRPTTDPLIVHLESAEDLGRIAIPNQAAGRLARISWPGPLTMVSPKRTVVPGIVSAGLPSVAVRVPSHPLFRRLLKLAGVPLAAPSANAFGYISPTTARHVRQGLGGKIKHILDGGPARIGLESTIVDLRDPKRPRLLRPGAITQTQLESALGQKLTALRRTQLPRKPAGAQVAPGLLLRHYSPRTPVQLHERFPARRPSAPNEAWVSLAKPHGPRLQNCFWLDPRGNLHGIARRLFATLRQLDDGRFRMIHVELARGGGLADAINDRLRRAAAR
jgi:L-threonylcarbamoyladenylate synthase